MTPLVIDASAVAEFLFRSPSGLAIEPRIVSSDFDLHVPALCDVEICAVVRRALLRDVMERERALQLLQDYRDLPLTRHGHLVLCARSCN